MPDRIKSGLRETTSCMANLMQSAGRPEQVYKDHSAVSSFFDTNNGSRMVRACDVVD